MKKKYILPIILLFSILIGSLLGVIFKEDILVIKPLGDIFLNLLFTIVVPLVFFTISSSIANMGNLKKLSKILRSTFLVFVITSAIAALFMLGAVILSDPASGANIVLEPGTEATLEIGEQIVKAITVSDFSLILSKNNMLPLIIFSALFGIGVAMVGEKGKKLAESLNTISLVMMKVIKVIMYYAPIGLCAYFAALIGEFGPNLLGSYAKSMLIYYGLSIAYFLIFYTLYAYIAGGKKGVKKFYRNIFSPFITSLATQSSLASLPTNIDAAANMRISKDVREVTLPIGATMHMEGSSMGSILKIAFLFSIFGFSFTGIDTYLIAILIAVLSAVVMSGIPGGGMIGEMLIVSLYGFPLSAFPIIATIGWLIDPPATSLNVCGDIASTMMIEKMVE